MRSLRFLVFSIFFLPRIASAQFWAALPPVGANSGYDISFSQDEKFVYYLSSESGIANIFRVSVKGGAPQQITKFADAPVIRAMHMLGRGYVVFMKGNTPSDSDYHIYRIADDGTGDALDITPSGPGVKSTIIGASYNGQFIYYTENKENLAKIDCYRYDNNQNISQLDLPNDKDYQVMAWSRDHSNLLVKDPADQSLSLFDVETTERKLLLTPNGSESITEALLSPDNHELILLKRTASGSIEMAHEAVGSNALTSEPAGDITHLDFSPNGKYRFQQHADGTIAVQTTATKEALPLTATPIAIGIAPRENLIAYVSKNADGVKKLSLYNVEKKTTLELATIK